MKPTVLALVGPTASGKTALALHLAQALNGEVLCMDSMQVYRGMDIGTAKPTKEEQALVPHHLLDIVDPGTPFSVAEYEDLAKQAIEGITGRGRLPILCGGTGLYLKALSGGMDFGGAAADPIIREKYQQLAYSAGNEAVHARLAAIDPDSAKALHPNNLRRVIRALEVYELTGQAFSSQTPKAQDRPYDIRAFALDWPRETLYQRINQRVDSMLKEGLLEEARAIFALKLPPEAQSLQGLGYKEFFSFFKGEGDLNDAIDTLKRRTRNYAKRQLTWFRADKSVRWLSGIDGAEQNARIIKQEMDSK